MIVPPVSARSDLKTKSEQILARLTRGIPDRQHGRVWSSAGASMHHHKAAWNALLFGSKLWVLTPPAES